MKRARTGATAAPERGKAADLLIGAAAAEARVKDAPAERTKRASIFVENAQPQQNDRSLHCVRVSVCGAGCGDQSSTRAKCASLQPIAIGTYSRLLPRRIRTGP